MPPKVLFSSRFLENIWIKTAFEGAGFLAFARFAYILLISPRLSKAQGPAVGHLRRGVFFPGICLRASGTCRSPKKTQRECTWTVHVHSPRAAFSCLPRINGRHTTPEGRPLQRCFLCCTGAKLSCTPFPLWTEQCNTKIRIAPSSCQERLESGAVNGGNDEAIRYNPAARGRCHIFQLSMGEANPLFVYALRDL